MREARSVPVWSPLYPLKVIHGANPIRAAGGDVLGGTEGPPGFSSPTAPDHSGSSERAQGAQLLGSLGSALSKQNGFVSKRF